MKLDRWQRCSMHLCSFEDGLLICFIESSKSINEDFFSSSDEKNVLPFNTLKIKVSI